MKDLSSLLSKAFSASLLILVVGAGLAFLLQTLAARLLGVSEYGIYVYVLTWINMLSLLVTLGMDASLLRLVPSYVACYEWALLHGLMRFTAVLVVVAGSIVAVIVSAISLVADPAMSKSITNVFLIAALLFPLIGLARLREAALRGLAMVVKAAAPENVIRPILVIGLLLLVFNGLGCAATAVRLMMMNVAGAFVVFLLGSYYLYSALPKEMKGVACHYERKNWLRLSAPMLLISGMHLLLKQSDIVMLGMIASTDLAGIYSVATRISDLVTFGLVASNSIVAPLISRYYSQGDHVTLQRMITISSRGVLMFALLLTVVLWAMAPYLLQLFGTGFVSGGGALKILLAAQLINALSGSVGFLMTMTGFQVQAAWILGISAILNVVLNYLLIPVYGLEGAAVATACAMIFWNLIMIVFVLHKLNINPTPFSWLLTR